jgi:hypothetical protein
MKRLFFLYMLFIILFIMSCDYMTLKRDNPLDPDNPDSKRDLVSLVELFVNDNISYCPFAEAGVEDLLLDGGYMGKIVIMQYHIHINTPDTYSGQVSDMTELRERYNFLRGIRIDGLPDIYVNGVYNSDRDNAVQGASDADSVKERVNSLLNREGVVSYFTIEGSIVKSTQPVLNVTIAKLGRGDATGNSLKSVVIENITDNLHYVVRDLLPSKPFSLKASERTSIIIESATITVADINNISGAVWIEDSDGRVLQSAYIR